METENKSASWSLRFPRQRMLIPNVRHRGLLYPPRMFFEWVRDDGLAVELEVEMTQDRGATVRRFAVTAPQDQTLGGADFRQPVPSMARRGAEAWPAFEPDGRGNASYPPMGAPVVRPVRARRTDESRLRRIARLVEAAEAAGESVISGIVREEAVSRGQAYNLISEARRAGFLPPSGPGRKPKKGDKT